MVRYGNIFMASTVKSGYAPAEGSHCWCFVYSIFCKYYFSKYLKKNQEKKSS